MNLTPVIPIPGEAESKVGCGAEILRLYHFDANEGGTYTDSSIYGKNATRTVGTLTGGNPLAKFGAGSLYANAVNNIIISVPAGAECSMTADYAFECWVYASATFFGAPSCPWMIRRPSHVGSIFWRCIIYSSSGDLRNHVNLDVGGIQAISVLNIAPIGEWVHIRGSHAFIETKSANDYYRFSLFVNGALVGTYTYNVAAGNTAIPYFLEPTSEIWIGRSDYQTFMYLNGYIDDWALLRGKFTAPFDKPTKTLCDGGNLATQDSSFGPPRSSLSFSSVIRPRLFAIVGSSIGTVTLATLTCTDIAATAKYSATFPGLSFNLSWVAPKTGTLTISGTPTGDPIHTKLTVSYIGSDAGKATLGITQHDITIVDASKVLTLGNMKSVSCTEGVYLVATPLVDLSSNYDLDLTYAIRSGRPADAPNTPGAALALAWDRQARLGSFTIAGAMAYGTYTLIVDYFANGVLAATSTHTIIVSHRYEAPPPAPAPVPPPLPPAPSPPPAPAPVPGPSYGGDPYFDDVGVLLHFDAISGFLTDQKGNFVTSAAGGAEMVGGGAVRECARIVPGFGNGVFVREDKNIGRSQNEMTVECFVKMSDSTWNALMAPGGDERWCQVAAHVNGSGMIVWALGFASWITTRAYGGGDERIVVPVGIAYTLAPDAPAERRRARMALGPTLRANPRRLTHLAMCRRIGNPGRFVQAAWFNGDASLYTVGDELSNLIPAEDKGRGLLHIGTSMTPIAEQMDAYVATPIAFDGWIDEYRLTYSARYAAKVGLTNALPLEASSYSLPWPDTK